MSWIEDTSYTFKNVDTDTKRAAAVFEAVGDLLDSDVDRQLRFNTSGWKDINVVDVRPAHNGEGFREGVYVWTATVRFNEWKVGSAPEWVGVWGTLNPLPRAGAEVVVHEW